MKIGEAGFVVCVSIQQIPLFSSERRFPAGERTKAFTPDRSIQKVLIARKGRNLQTKVHKYNQHLEK